MRDYWTALVPMKYLPASYSALMMTFSLFVVVFSRGNAEDITRKYHEAFTKYKEVCSRIKSFKRFHKVNLPLYCVNGHFSLAVNIASIQSPWNLLGFISLLNI